MAVTVLGIGGHLGRPHERQSLMADYSETSAAIYDAILGLLKDAEDYGGNTRAEMVRDAAIAYRAVKGGAQPGSSVIEK